MEETEEKLFIKDIGKYFYIVDDLGKKVEKIKFEDYDAAEDWAIDNFGSNTQIEDWYLNHVEQPKTKKPKKVKLLSVEELLNQLRQHGKIALIWSIEDVIGKGKEMELDFEISEEKALEILDNVDRHHDCEYGVTWEHIETEINNYFKL